MQYVSIHETKTHLSRLIRKIAEGEEIVITSSGKPVATLTAPPKAKKRVFGDMQGKPFFIPDDFDDPMPEEWFDSEDEDHFYKPSE